MSHAREERMPSKISHGKLLSASLQLEGCWAAQCTVQRNFMFFSLSAVLSCGLVTSDTIEAILFVGTPEPSRVIAAAAVAK